MKGILVVVTLLFGLYLFTPDNQDVFPGATNVSAVTSTNESTNDFRDKLLALEVEVKTSKTSKTSPESEKVVVEDLQESQMKDCGCLDNLCQCDVTGDCKCEYCVCSCHLEVEAKESKEDQVVNDEPEYEAPYILVLNFDKSNWWETSKSEWETVGWNVYGEFGHSELSTPIFKVYNNGKEKVFVGDLTAEDVRKSFDLGEKPVTTNTSARWTAQELTQMVNNIYSSGSVPLYGTMKSDRQVWHHLKYDTKHGYTSEQVDGLPMSVAVKLHNLDHGGRITPFRTRKRTQVQSQPQRVQQSIRVEYTPFTGGNCATGNCARR